MKNAFSSQLFPTVPEDNLMHSLPYSRPVRGGNSRKTSKALERNHFHSRLWEEKCHLERGDHGGGGVQGTGYRSGLAQGHASNRGETPHGMRILTPRGGIWAATGAVRVALCGGSVAL